MNNGQFRGHLVLLAEVTNKDLSGPLIELWWTTFGDLPDHVLLTGFHLAMQSAEFFPTPARFRQLLGAIAAEAGAPIGGQATWEAMERDIFRRWSETGDRLIASTVGGKYPWPDDRSREVLRGQLTLTVRDVVMMHPAEYAATRERFVELYDEGRMVAEAHEAVDRLATGNVRRLDQGAD